MDESEKQIETYRELLQVFNITRLADRLDINYRTLNDFANGNTKTPAADVILKLQKYFEGK